LDLDHNDANNEPPTTELKAARNGWKMTSSQNNASVRNRLLPNSDLARSVSVEGSPALSASRISQYSKRLATNHTKKQKQRESDTTLNTTNNLLLKICKRVGGREARNCEDRSARSKVTVLPDNKDAKTRLTIRLRKTPPDRISANITVDLCQKSSIFSRVIIMTTPEEIKQSSKTMTKANK
jgi:hypothetical protein